MKLVRALRHHDHYPAGWLDLPILYRQRNEVEYNFSELQSDLFNGVRRKSENDSAEGSLFVNFQSLRLRNALIHCIKAGHHTDRHWAPTSCRRPIN